MPNITSERKVVHMINCQTSRSFQNAPFSSDCAQQERQVKNKEYFTFKKTNEDIYPIHLSFP